MSSALNFVPWNPQLRITQFLPDFLNMEISMFIINCINLNFFIGCTLINIIVIWHYSQLDVNKCLLVPLWEHMTGQIKDSTNFYFVKPMTLIGLITGIWVMDYLQEEKLIKDSCIKYNHLNMSDSSWMPETWIQCICVIGWSWGWRVTHTYSSVGLNLFLSAVFISQISLQLICVFGEHSGSGTSEAIT